MQSSALPLGHAARKDFQSFHLDRISKGKRYLLILSNGHGEDLISLRILEELYKLNSSINLEVLPLVGEGKIFDNAIRSGWITKIGPKAKLPSGGFSNQSFSGLIADISGGLIWNTWKQWKIIQRLSSPERVILAVGDILPLLFARLSRCDFGFIGTPKSDYSWKSGPGSSLSDYYHCLKGTEWEPWEYGLMKSSNCKFVAVRDKLTSRGLRRKGVIALAPGNPMMDGLSKEKYPTRFKFFRRIILLCGSRLPEAIDNFKRLIKAIELIQIEEQMVIFIATSSSTEIGKIKLILSQLGYKQDQTLIQGISAESYWKKNSKSILIGSGEFSNWANWAEIGLANAGTATEQLVGLGIPALSLPGKGPQFKKSFAKRQSRLLGGAVIPCKDPEVLAERLGFLLKNHLFKSQLGLIGSRRMGQAGGSSSIAHLIQNMLLKNAKDI